MRQTGAENMMFLTRLVSPDTTVGQKLLPYFRAELEMRPALQLSSSLSSSLATISLTGGKEDSSIIDGDGDGNDSEQGDFMFWNILIDFHQFTLIFL